MPEERPSPAVERLSLSREEQWTLHDVLRDHLEAGDERSEDADATDCRAAFERLDDGRLRFTRAQLETMRRTLARAHHRRRWEVERPQLEGLLHRISRALE
ncbi:hypothetical protein C2R22_20420 [Salinigranum rubrum]|uniref:Uncharacterized protein n=1 Tax=Salinigranum rubrum TaxID=755307 RepID=A0A2I8VP73_9EURY|nr:hypothetical protein [Salinigranum rubrum]AUV83718.1 hypothetical protein C2R22_20420 [Salinigranum rubrum]